MPRRRALRTASVIVLSIGGIMVGHAITYAGLAPVALAREAWLMATGHGYLSATEPIASAALLGVLGIVFLRGLTGPATAPETLTRRLLAFGLIGFLLLEVAERLASGSGFGDLVRVLPVGLVIQAGLALAVAGTVRFLLRAAVVVVGFGAGRSDRPRGPILARLGFAQTAGRSIITPFGERAPPSSR